MALRTDRSWSGPLSISLVLLLGGCAFGQSYNYEDAAISLGSVTSTGAVAVAVHDARPYVISGGKRPTFVGLKRGGFGEPHNVSTDTGKPMAEEMRGALAKSMASKGLNVASIDTSPTDSADRIKQNLIASNARRSVLVTLNEWKSDTMARTLLSYDVTLVVFDGRGTQLASNQINGDDNLGGLGLTPSAGISAAFAKRFETLFNDEKIIAALR